MADRAIGVPFAKEGIPFIAVPAGVTLLTGWLDWPVIACVGSVATVFSAWFFRNPARLIPQGPKLVVAPGDGKVIAIEEEFEPRYLKERSVRLTIFLNVFDVHINRLPCDGVVEGVQRIAIAPADQRKGVYRVRVAPVKLQGDLHAHGVTEKHR